MSFRIEEKHTIRDFRALKRNRKFLIVEDDPSMHLVWEEVIQYLDPSATIKWATTEEGAEGHIRAKFQANDYFDFIVADVLLAGQKTGVDLWKKFGGGKTRFLFASSVSIKRFVEMMGEGDQTPLPHFLKKPFGIAESIESLRALL